MPLGSSRLKSSAKGVAVIDWRGDAVMSAVDGMASQRLDAAAILVVATAKASMNESKSGKPGPKRTRSAPGEAPATQLETLRNKIAWDAPSQLRRRVGTDVDYGLFLELGAYNPKTGAILYPRPWLEVALWANADKIKRLFRR